MFGRVPARETMTAQPPSSPRVRVAVNAVHAKSGGVTYLGNMILRLAADERLELYLILTEGQRGLFGPFAIRASRPTSCPPCAAWSA